MYLSSQNQAVGKAVLEVGNLEASNLEPYKALHFFCRNILRKETP